jgi:GNAT superfamily N-acetyltransferase
MANFKQFYSLVESPFIDNEPVQNVTKMELNPNKKQYDETVEYKGLTFGITSSERKLLFIDIIQDDLVIGHIDGQIIEYEGKEYFAITFISIHPKYQGQGISSKSYDWLIEKYDGIISDKSLSKTRKGGSFYTWKSLSKRYSIYIVDWLLWKNYGVLEFKRTRSDNIDGWVGANKANKRLAILG